MKKNRLMRIAALLLVLTLATSCFVGGTFAKYVSTTTATDTAHVAVWKFTSDADTGDNIVQTETFTFDIFNTVKEIGGTAEEEVANTEGIIAPGTYGTVTVALTNDSEVDATYKVAFTAMEEEVPLQWSVDGTTWKDNVDACDLGVTDIDMGATKNVVLHWKWAFTDDDVVTQTDAKDTELGINGAAPSVTVTVTFEQRD